MKCEKRSIISAFLCLIMAMSSIVVFSNQKASAAFDGYIAIGSKAELYNIRNNLAAKYYLTNDIVFTEADFAVGGEFYNGGAGWKSIGTSYKFPFRGIINGNGFSVVGLKTNVSDANVGMLDPVITDPYDKDGDGWSDGYVTAIAPPAFGIETNEIYGGLVGYNKGNILNLGISNFSFKFNLSTDNYTIHLGAVSGVNAGIISSCFTSGDIECNTNYNAYVGGVSGDNILSAAMISDCFNSTDIILNDADGAAFSGGLIGRMTEGQLKKSYNVGKISGNCLPGALVGRNLSIISNSYYLDNMSTGVAKTNDSKIRLTKEQMQNPASFPGFDFTNIWKMSESYKLPVLKSVSAVDIVSIGFSNSTLVLKKGEKVSCGAKITPPNATFKALNYSINDSTVASVSPNGEVTALKSGSARLTISTTFGIQTAEQTVAVTNSGDINNDGEITTKDIALLKRHIAKWQGISIDLINADVNHDGNIDNRDAAILKRYFAKWENITLE